MNPSTARLPAAPTAAAGFQHPYLPGGLPYMPSPLSPFFPEALGSPSFLNTPSMSTAFFQYFAQRSPPSAQPPVTETAAVLLSLNQPVVHQDCLPIEQTKLPFLGLPAAVVKEKPDRSREAREDSSAQGSDSGLDSTNTTDLSPPHHCHLLHSLTAGRAPSHSGPAPQPARPPHGWPTLMYPPRGASPCGGGGGGLGFASQHSRTRTNTCYICGKTYARSSTLRTHMRSHNGEKPFQCRVCLKSFTQAANLTAHMRTHSGEKPFKCSVCDRRFSQSSSVTTHMRTHSGDRPYQCSVCSKSFADSSTLTKHFRTHSGEKPYHCQICDARFSQSGNLNRHMKTHRTFRY